MFSRVSSKKTVPKMKWQVNPFSKFPGRCLLGPRAPSPPNPSHGLASRPPGPALDGTLPIPPFPPAPGGGIPHHGFPYAPPPTLLITPPPCLDILFVGISPPNTRYTMGRGNVPSRAGGRGCPPHHPTPSSPERGWGCPPTPPCFFPYKPAPPHPSGAVTAPFTVPHRPPAGAPSPASEGGGPSRLIIRCFPSVGRAPGSAPAAGPVPPPHSGFPCIHPRPRPPWPLPLPPCLGRC